MAENRSKFQLLTSLVNSILLRTITGQFRSSTPKLKRGMLSHYLVHNYKETLSFNSFCFSHGRRILQQQQQRLQHHVSGSPNDTQQQKFCLGSQGLNPNSSSNASCFTGTRFGHDGLIP
jgi:hypothetical protein